MEEEIQKSIEALKSGGTIIYPTDTIWGIGCDATNPKAVDKIYKIKKRSKTKNLIVLIDDKSKLKDFVKSIPEIAWDLIDKVDKPLTIIYPDGINIAKNILGPDGSVAIRITKDEFSKKLIKDFGKPIVSTSANISGDSPPLSYRKIPQEIIDNADYIVNLYHDTINEVKASTIIKFVKDEEFTVIRK
ncbi:MAG: threonylcarbamoyl-AMP synthase [Saprospiraceae bacterium]|nr:threonylcarbamoyl-AMP synthase [Saprospiraceae bacterium]